MGARNTYHEYATRIEIICDEFTKAHVRGAGDLELVEITKPASDLLMALALNVRNDKDYGLTTNSPTRVGSLLEGAFAQRPSAFRPAYRPPFDAVANSHLLSVRDAFNKIAHADSSDAAYYIDEQNYEIIICGKEAGRAGKPWLAVISIPTLLKAVKLLPDKLLSKSAP